MGNTIYITGLNGLKNGDHKIDWVGNGKDPRIREELWDYYNPNTHKIIKELIKHIIKISKQNKNIISTRKSIY